MAGSRDKIQKFERRSEPFDVLRLLRTGKEEPFGFGAKGVFRVSEVLTPNGSALSTPLRTLYHRLPT